MVVDIEVGRVRFNICYKSIRIIVDIGILDLGFRYRVLVGLFWD